MVEGTSLFDANVATVSGCALYGHSLMYILFIGNTTLSGNGEQKPLTSSGQILLQQTEMADIQFHGYTEIKHSFSNLRILASFQGNVCALFRGTTKFFNNTGGFLLMGNASINFFGQTYFEGNHGNTIALKNSRPPNPSMISGEATFLDNDSGICLSNSEIKLKGDFYFTHNGGPRHTSMYAFGSTVTINGSMLMNHNVGNAGPAIFFPQLLH